MCLALTRHILYQRWLPCDPALSSFTRGVCARECMPMHKEKSPESSQSCGRVLERGCSCPDMASFWIKRARNSMRAGQCAFGR